MSAVNTDNMEAGFPFDGSSVDAWQPINTALNAIAETVGAPPVYPVEPAGAAAKLAGDREKPPDSRATARGTETVATRSRVRSTAPDPRWIISTTGQASCRLKTIARKDLRFRTLPELAHRTGGRISD